jgi:hypothetical protein
VTGVVAPADAELRALAIAQSMLARFGLDLHGLAVLTEAASGPYLATPVLAAMAGARRVIAVTRDSRWASAHDVTVATMRLAALAGVAERLHVVDAVADDAAGDADIVTNSGFLRPIDAALVRRLRVTAALPLMFEPWEARESDIDLAACRDRGIVVLGTNEHAWPCDMRPYSAALGVRLLFDLGLEVVGCRVLALGAQAIIGLPAIAALRSLGADVRAFSGAEDEIGVPGVRAYADLTPDDLVGLDAVLVADHREPSILLGPGGVVDLGALADASPAVRIALIAGRVDVAALRSSGLLHQPPADALQPVGTMHVSPAALGPGPVLMLYSAGLAVGAATTRARLAGASPDEARAAALAQSPALDFDRAGAR